MPYPKERIPKIELLGSIQTSQLAKETGALIDGTASVFTPPSIRPRSDAKISNQRLSYKDRLIEIAQSIARESSEMKHAWGDRQNEWRIALDANHEIVFRITDAASPHTATTIEVDGKTYSGMMMVWFWIESKQDLLEPTLPPTLTIATDESSDSGVSFFSNQQLIQEFASLPPLVLQTLNEALVTAVTFLQDKLQIRDEELSAKIDICMGIGSRLEPELKFGKQGVGSQSGPLGHFTVVYHDDFERTPAAFNQVRTTSKDVLKVMDPWVEFLLQHFSESLLTIALAAVERNPNFTGLQVEFQNRWDGLEICFPDGASSTQAYAVVSSIYNTLSAIQRQSLEHYKTFLNRGSRFTNTERIIFSDELAAIGLSKNQIQQYVTFIESLSPTHSIVTELLQGRIWSKKKREKIEKIAAKMKKYNDPERVQQRNTKWIAGRNRLTELMDERLRLLKLANPVNNLTEEDERTRADSVQHLESRLRTERSRRYMAHLLGQLYVDPALRPLAIETMIPQNRVTAVTVVKDFTVDTSGLQIQRLIFALSFSGRGGFEVMTESGAISRERPAT